MPDGVTMRVALAQVDSTVGDLAGNAEAVLVHTRAAAAAGAQLVAFPELMITGYPPEDLVLRPQFRVASRAAVDELAPRLAAAGLGEIAVVVGYVDDDGRPRNASAFLYGGRVVARGYKHHLPNYGVFDEHRYFTPGEAVQIVRHRGVDVALSVCEDLWQPGGPITAAGAAGAGLVVNINASPFELRKDRVRLDLLRRRAAEAGAPIAYVNTVGGQDELAFDGDSMVVAPDGTVLLRAPHFDEQLVVVDLALAAAPSRAPEHDRSETAGGLRVWRTETDAAPADPPAPPMAAQLCEVPGDEEQVWGALVTGLRDYVRKNGFRSVVLGVSGGIDSAVVAAVAADAIGGDGVYGVSMPSEYSTEHSKSDAFDLTERLGAHFREVPIKAMVDAFVTSLSLSGVAEENVQARIRGTLLMAVSNAEGHLVIATGNKSELAVGYATIYDAGSIGGFAPLKDVPKSYVWALARWRNAQAQACGETLPIPPNSITKAPSAELRPGQLDTDSLPDYAVLDRILERYVDHDLGIEDIVAEGFDADLVRRVARLVDAAEWKRRQYPIGTKVSSKAFGRDRRMPVTNRWRRPS